MTPEAPPINRSGMTFTDRVALITGGSRGIGQGCARVFVDAGARVMICGRNVEDGEQVARELNDRGPGPPPGSTEMRMEDLDDWMEIFCRLVGSSLEKHRTHREILETIPAHRLLATLVDAGQVVACGLGVLEGGMLGIFDLFTDPGQRNKGYGTVFVSHLLEWASQNGATDAYLQVVSTNEPARHLYAKCGFREAYRYWYRVTSA